MEKFLSVSADVLSAIWDGMLIIGAWLIDFGGWLYDWFTILIEKTDIPLFSKSKILGTISISGTIFALLILFMLVANIRAYHAFSIDKKIARANGRSKDGERMMRKSERHLLWLCFWGGALGGFLGMLFEHHKTKKKKFLFFVPLFTFVQISVYSIAIGFFSFWLFFR